MTWNLRESMTMTTSILQGTEVDMAYKVNDLEYINKMTSLREEILIKKGLLYFLLPAIIEGFLGCFLPVFYVVIPVHEADFCLCSFFD